MEYKYKDIVDFLPCRIRDGGVSIFHLNLFEKQIMLKQTKIILCLSFFWLLAPLSSADEGMWLFDNPPRKQVEEKYGFELTDQWLNHVQLSSVRFGRSGSASFVSSNGLVLTNHHVGARQLASLSTPDRDLLETGFYAENLEDELKCQGLELNVLISTENVTKKVNEAIKPGMNPEESELARRAVMNTIEQESTEKTGLKSEVMTLYQGGEYHLYRYKIYNDVRLVFAPESKIASFGGDPDNYEYPRYCLDATFFRAYEDGKPAKIEHFLKWSNEVKDGELVFVSGHPGTTNRAYTREHLEHLRDVYFPHRLMKLYRREVLLSVFADRSDENFQRVRNELDSIKNYRKRAIGQLQGLQTPSLLNTVTARSPEIAAIVKDSGPLYCKYDLYEAGEAFNCRTFQLARTIVRLAVESEKPNSERLREYRESAIDSLKKSLLADTPIHEDIEILKLSDSLMMLQELEWDEHFKELSPKELARKLVQGSKLRDAKERERLIEGGLKAIESSDDEMIKFVAKIDPFVRGIRKQYEEKISEPLRTVYAKLADERFEKLGTSVYPDATFTLRLSPGAVLGYKEDDGTTVVPITDIAGMYARAESHKFKPPYDPPQSWKDKKSALDMSTPFNLVSTNDIIGGNSGSPLINTKGEIIGLVFDGNIYSLSNNFIYTEEQSRCVSVHTAVIMESLRKVYGAEKLADELGK